MAASLAPSRNPSMLRPGLADRRQVVPRLEVSNFAEALECSHRSQSANGSVAVVGEILTILGFVDGQRRPQMKIFG